MSVSELHIAVSGRPLRIEAVKLHREAEVRAWQEKLADAQEQLGGFSTGIGVLASPGVAIASAAAIGILEAAVSSSKEKKGLRYLVEATEMLARLREAGEFVPVSQIEGMSVPVPSHWCVSEEGEVVTDLKSYGVFERTKIIEEHKVSFGESMMGSFTRPGKVKAMIVLPDEFIWLKTSNGETAVRWTTVDSYRVAD